ncbi:MAG TPA: PD-(D/E)XK nuclease family protein [Anaerolineales bacterium]|nr:PD-(D/E)XK nuclease family protein [Anaerolineales bacterium]
MLYLIVLIILLASGLLWLSARQRKAAGLPAGRVIYTDTNRWGPLEKPLYDAQFGLTGKPDYLVYQKDQIIPVEVKSRRVKQAAPDGHIFQLAAYCLLVERIFGKRPPYGILHYPNRTMAVDFTPELEAAVIELIGDMHAQERRQELDRSHDSAARCARCGYRSICDQAIR